MNKRMIFIDGSNFMIELSKQLDVPLKADIPNTKFVQAANRLLKQSLADVYTGAWRRYWFASYRGSEQTERDYSEMLRGCNLEPMLYKKNSGKEKGVDIGLATEMLVNAFNQNYDYALLVAGDKDYVQLVYEVKRYGPIVSGTFFEDSLSDDLRLSFDKFYPIGHFLSGKILDEYKELVLNTN